ncbi:MAG: alpha-L-rhamnosidase [Clostridia bacterium]|nr:alpha-L-rhamnosidase [Clostridia bacterium]
MQKSKITAICAEIARRLAEVHTVPFFPDGREILLISDTYPGIWLEHVYDSVFYAKLDPSKRQLAENAVRLFIEHQRPDGQLPFAAAKKDGIAVRYSQIQECVSFARLSFEVYQMNRDRAFLETIYQSAVAWDAWLCRHRMTTGRGLIEMFCGYDSGHDNSGRLLGMAYPRNHSHDGEVMDAGVLPTGDDVTPILAVDMNCHFYNTKTALADMADELGLLAEADAWRAQAAAVKLALFEHCYDPFDGYFYDVDRHGNKRRVQSSTLFHLFSEHVLDPETDVEVIERLYREHIHNPESFWTPYPFPSVSIADPTWKKHTDANCWGYFSQALIALRCTRWMDDYGFSADFDHLCNRWIEAWTRCYDTVKLGQELDPLTGEPSSCSEWYSSCMLFYLYAARRLGLVE